jgi:hypothetical protein
MGQETEKLGLAPCAFFETVIELWHRLVSVSHISLAVKGAELKRNIYPSIRNMPSITGEHQGIPCPSVVAVRV